MTEKQAIIKDVESANPKPPTKLYQLQATGCIFTGEHHGISSAKVFASREAAEAYEDEFRQVVSTPINDFDIAYLVNVDRVKVLELELMAESITRTKADVGTIISFLDNSEEGTLERFILPYFGELSEGRE